MAKHPLCKPCAVRLSEGRSVKYLAGGRNQKDTCWLCGRRRYVAIYDVRRNPARRVS
jgi:hypothetical protein